MKTEINCIGLVNSNGVKFITKVKFEMELSDGTSFVRKGKTKIYSKPEFFIKRQAFETINSSGQKIFWYDNDKNMIVKISRYGQLQYNKIKQTAIN